MGRADRGRLSANPPEAARPHGQLPLEDRRRLPPRVHAVLAGRLQQLSASAREFVERAAIIGREFTDRPFRMPVSIHGTGGMKTAAAESPTAFPAFENVPLSTALSQN